MTTVIETPTPNFSSSFDFYSKLGFSILSKEDPTLLTDGHVIVEINPEKSTRAAIKLYKESWQEEVVEIEKITKIIQKESKFTFCDPCGVWIHLIEKKHEKGYDLSHVKPSVLGNYAGISLESIDISKSLQLWMILGFKISMGGVEQGWVSLANVNGTTISLMKPFSCPHLFFNPSLTYFNGKNNLKVIEKLRQLEIPFSEEIIVFNKEGIVDNVIIRDPGGYGFFIFSD